eukprot:1192261-Pleurochrysis_carterae.AAC.1
MATERGETEDALGLLQLSTHCTGNNASPNAGEGHWPMRIEEEEDEEGTEKTKQSDSEARGPCFVPERRTYGREQASARVSETRSEMRKQRRRNQEEE